MKTFKQFTEQNKFNTTNTKDALKNVFSGKGFGELKQKVKGGDINIGDMKNFANSDEAKNIPFKVLSGFLKDTSKMVEKATTKVNDLKTKFHFFHFYLLYLCYLILFLRFPTKLMPSKKGLCPSIEY